jgi:crotonobetainyl-CoA:carnitine CoA-transferase CaiB-like acyl-CoA transferase
MSQSSALAPLRVLDLTTGLPGSVVTLLLAQYGAEVIKVEPGRDSLNRRLGLHRTWDRGKRSIVLDIADGSDRATVAELATAADVLVDGFRAGRLEELGLGYTELRSANPSLVHCSLSGYGEHTRWRDRPGVDALVAARLGVMSDQPGYRDGPIFVGHPAIGYGTALLATIAVLAALRARYLTGLGQHVDASMLDGILAQETMHWASDAGFASFVRERTGRPNFGRRRLVLGYFECSDGKLIHVHTGAVGGFSRAMKVFGLDDRVSSGGGAVEMSSEMTEEEAATLWSELPKIIKTRPADEWLKTLWENEVGALPLQPPGDAFDDPQVQHNALVETIDDAELGQIDVVAPAIKLSETPAPAGLVAPGLDADGKTIREHGWQGPRAPVAEHLRELEHPLDGIRIAEFSTFFAASYAGRLLSDLGAEVVKIETVNGDPMRPLLDMFEGASGGKRSLAINLKTPEGVDAVRRLLDDADIVCHNQRPGAAERLGIDYESIRAFNEDIVYCYAPGFGSGGPKARLQSFAPLQSGFAGLFHEAAGVGNAPLAQFGNEDYYNGLLAACGIMLALVHRERTGTGQLVESPQLHSSVFATCHVVRRYGETIRFIPFLDQEQTGYDPFYRIYECAEGWLCIAATNERHVQTVLESVGVESSGLASAFATRTAAEWFEVLDANGVPCEVARDSRREELYRDPELLRLQYTAEREHPVVGRVFNAGLMFHLSETPGLLRGRAPMLGEHSREILAELGFDEATIDEWLDREIVRGSVSESASEVGTAV